VSGPRLPFSLRPRKTVVRSPGVEPGWLAPLSSEPSVSACSTTNGFENIGADDRTRTGTARAASISDWCVCLFHHVGKKHREELVGNQGVEPRMSEAADLQSAAVTSAARCPK